MPEVPRAMEIGYVLSSEEHGPRELVRFARDAEQSGFTSASISDHFHPWTDDQGQSPFVWSVIGALAATTGLHVTTGVTCPIVRMHPAIVAQAAATSAAMMPGRFRLGVGTGESLNEHIVGRPRPPVSVRLEMLEEAVAVIRRLWSGETVTHTGRHHTVWTARLYTLPDFPPPVLMSAFGPRAVAVAARIADGLQSVSPDADTVRLYREDGGRGPAVAGVKVCWAPTFEQARATAHRLWRHVALPGQLAQELPMPDHFAQAASVVTEEQVAAIFPCGPDPEPYVSMINRYRNAGFDEVDIHQIGGDQRGFLRFYQRELVAELGRAGHPVGASAR